MRDKLFWAWASIALYPLVGLFILLTNAGYADVLAGLLALSMVALGIWLSAKGMAQLKQHEINPISGAALETAYRYRNAGIALG